MLEGLSMHAQITCTDKLVITDDTTGFPESVHDARVFHISSLYSTLQLLTPPILWILLFLHRPFRDNGHLSAVEKHYNYVHSSSRCCIERRCTGLLKGYEQLYKLCASAVV